MPMPRSRLHSQRAARRTSGACSGWVLTEGMRTSSQTAARCEAALRRAWSRAADFTGTTQGRPPRPTVQEGGAARGWRCCLDRQELFALARQLLPRRAGAPGAVAVALARVPRRDTGAAERLHAARRDVAPGADVDRLGALGQVHRHC